MITIINIMERMLDLHIHTLTTFEKTNSLGSYENLLYLKSREFFQVVAM